MKGGDEDVKIILLILLLLANMVVINFQKAIIIDLEKEIKDLKNNKKKED